MAIPDTVPLRDARRALSDKIQMNVSGRTDAQNVLAAPAQMPIRDGKLGAQCSKVGITFGLALE